MLSQDHLLPLFADLHVVHYACLQFRLRCIAHRLINHGFEAFLNTYAPRELLLLSTILPPVPSAALVREAYAQGDTQLRAIVELHAPEALGKAVVHG